MASERTFTLLELNHMVRETIERQMDGKYWVEAELSDLHDRSHCYMELVENRSLRPHPFGQGPCGVLGQPLDGTAQQV